MESGCPPALPREGRSGARAGALALALLLPVAGCGIQRNFSLGDEQPPATPAARAASPHPAPSPPAAAPAPAPTPFPEDQPAQPRSGAIEVVAKALFQSADACQTTGRRLSLKIPDVDRLDDGFHGPVPGIEFREVARVNGGGYRHVRISGNTLEFELNAQGKGLLVEALGSKSCKNGEGATVGYDIIAHYR